MTHEVTVYDISLCIGILKIYTLELLTEMLNVVEGIVVHSPIVNPGIPPDFSSAMNPPKYQ